MDGKNMKRLVRELLNEPATSQFLDDRTTFDNLYEAAKEFTRLSECLRATQAITTVAEQAGYSVNGDFLALYLKDEDEDHYIKYNDGTNDHFLDYKPYQEIIWDNDTTSISIPGYWTITTDPTLDSQIAVDASQAGAATGGKCNLTVAADTFEDITPGDIVHNTDDGSDGVVVNYNTDKSIDICLFGGTANDITDTDSFIIQPRGRLLLQFEPPPKTADHTATLYYIQKPAPVYSDYQVYPFAFDYAETLAKYAAWLYKMRDSEPDFGHAWYQYFVAQANEYKRLFKGAFGRDKSNIRPRFM